MSERKKIREETRYVNGKYSKNELLRRNVKGKQPT
jgi:hypothetical protein